jgi:hypothetical protein
MDSFCPAAPHRRLCILLLGALSLHAEVSYLDNGRIRVGIDLDLGGVITYVAAAGGDNMINSADYGRQIQQSYYSGPKPYGQAHPAWAGWPWNPIGTGDVYKNKARVLAYTNDGQTLWVRSIPMQWALNNVPCECTFDTWITLSDAVATVRARLNNLRIDRTQYGAYDQELPAVYTNGPWYRLFTYDGLEPFTGAPLRQVQNSGPPWAYWQATENWAALIDDSGKGLGVFHPGVYRFAGGFAGRPGRGGPSDGPTGYISPVGQEILDHNIRYEYEYRLIAGTLQQIRDSVYSKRPDPRPDYVFHRGRAHWTYGNASDSGWPVRGRLRVSLERNDPQMIGPPGLWRAADVPKLYIRAAYHSQPDRAEIFWSAPDAGFSAARRVSIPVVGDGAWRTYEVAMPWEGLITGIRFDPAGGGGAGEYVDVRWISWRPQ